MTFRLTTCRHFVVAVVLAAPTARCRLPTGLPLGRDPVPLTRFTAAPGSYLNYSGIDDSARVVIRDASEWRRYWTTIHSRMLPEPPLPDVDFGRSVVLLAALGRRPSGGYAVRIERAWSRAGVLEVVVDRREPGRGCVVSAAVTWPVDIVRVKAPVDSVVFLERRTIESCR